jgi:hypothetical protein
VKHGLRPSKRQRIAIKAVGLNPDNWLVFKSIEGDLHLVHRETGTTKIIPA